MQKPFDDLQAVTELIKLYKDGVTQRDLVYYFRTTKENVQNTLRVYFDDLPIGRKRNVSRPGGYWGDKVVVPEQVEAPKSKYAYLIEEPINKGHDYAELLKKQGYKKPKMDSFDRIRRFKTKEEPLCE